MSDNAKNAENEQYHITNANDVIPLIHDCIESKNASEVNSIIYDLHESEAAKVLASLKKDELEYVLVHTKLGENLNKYIPWLSTGIMNSIIDIKGFDYILYHSQSLDLDDLTYFIDELDSDLREKLINSLSDYKRQYIEVTLKYHEDSAARIMQRRIVSIPDHWTIKNTKSYLKDLKKINHLSSMVYNLFIVDKEGKSVGILKAADLIYYQNDDYIKNYMERQYTKIQADMDQEDAAMLFRDRDMVSAPVVDANGVLIGAIHVTDIVDVIYEENEEDTILMSGSKVATDISLNKYKQLLSISMNRIVWLLLNVIGSAIFLPIIISSFQETLQTFIILAAIIPIINSTAGNAGLQSSAVVLVGISRKTITYYNFFSHIRREVYIALFNGAIISTMAFLVLSFVAHSDIGGVVAFTAFVNIILGVLTGSLLPLALKRMGFDHVTATSIFITSITDISGFIIALYATANFV